MDKESIIELQKIDCNCNDCVYLSRLLDKQNDILAADKISQEEIFYIVKDNKTKDIQTTIESLFKNKLIILNADKKISKLKNKLQVLKKDKYGYQGQKTPVQYGLCKRFNKEIHFIPNTLQLETQDCFIHRKCLKTN